MKGVYLTALLTICTHVFLTTGNEHNEAYCYQFTWPGTGITELDCDEHPNTPCLNKSLYVNDTKPNVERDIWDDPEKRKDLTQPLELGNVCVRFTYTYNGAAVNCSYFSGKVTEDRVMPVTSGCYVQYLDGYSIEVCACKSKGEKPCYSSTIRNTCSVLIVSVVVAVTLFMYNIFDIP